VACYSYRASWVSSTVESLVSKNGWNTSRFTFMKEKVCFLGIQNSEVGEEEHIVMIMIIVTITDYIHGAESFLRS
jgi:hypothetical protein